MFRSISLSADHTVRRNSGATPFNRDLANWVLRIGQCPVAWDVASSADPWVATTTAAPPATGLPQALYSSDMCEFTPTTTDAAAGSTTPAAATPMPTGADDDDAVPSARGDPVNPNGDFTLAVAPIGSTPPWSSIHPQVHNRLLNTDSGSCMLRTWPRPFHFAFT